jgi:phosphoglycerate dehydrogenase-like enzyme
MTLIWLPYDDWATDIAVPPQFEVQVWRADLPMPPGRDSVAYYVPDYLGDSSTIDVIAQLPALRVVQTLTAGVDHVLAALPPGLTLCNAAGVHDASTGELAVGLALASLRGLPDFVRAQAAGHWDHQFRRSLADRTVLVVGWGSIGQAIGRRLEPFEVSLVAVASRARAGVHGVDELPLLLPQADVVILAVPLTPGTAGLVDAAFLAAMPDGAVLVNVARGPVVDTQALLAELHGGRLVAALDVTDPEPLPKGHPLWQAPNLLISPHVGGNTSAYRPRAARLVSAQLARLVGGQPLANVVAGPSLVALD